MEDFIKGLAKTSKKTVEEITDLYTKTKAELEAQGITDDRLVRVELGKKLRNLIWVETHVMNGGSTRKKPVDFFGFVLGATRLVDTDEFKRRAAIKAFREDPVQAQLMGMTDEAGTPLDNRPTMKNRGKDVENPNYHKPLVSHTYTKTIYGIAMKNGGTEPRFFRLQLWRNTAKTFRYKPFVPVGFSAMLRDESNGFFELGPHKSMAFKTTAQEIDIETWIRKSSKIYLLSELEKAHASTKDAMDKWVFTEGDVIHIDTNVNANTGSRSIILSDVDNGFIESVRVFIPGDFPLGFREDSKVIILGQTRKWKPRDSDEEVISMEGFSVFPIPGKTTETSIKTASQGLPAEDEGQAIPWTD